MSKGQTLTITLLAAWLWIAIASSAFAARLLTATVELNGQTILRSKYQDDDFRGPPGAATVWRYLDDEPLGVEQGPSIKANTADLLRATLQGKLIIRLQHVDRVIVEAKADKLTLIRADPSSDTWFLPAEEVERLAKANNIPALPSPGLFEFARRWPWQSIAVLVLVVGLFAWLLLRRARQPSR